MESPVLARLKRRKPNFFLLMKPLIITEDYLDLNPKWQILLDWYKSIEKNPNTEWVDKAINTMINAAIYQERIYFAITRDTLVDLFKKDLNWKEGISLSPKNYSSLLREMIESEVFEAHPENERLKSQKKPMIFKVVSPAVLSLIKTVPEDDQEKQVLEFVEDYKDEIKGNDSGNSLGNDSGNSLGNTDSKIDSKIDSKEKNASAASYIENTDQVAVAKYTFDQYLILYWPQWPSYKELEDMVKYAIVNCSDFDNSTKASVKLKNHLETTVDKMTAARKKFAKGLCDQFKIYTDKYLKIMEANAVKTELKTPDEKIFSTTKIVIEEENMIQNNTIRILNASFGKENIQLLKRRLDNTIDLDERNIIQQEISFWESVIYE